MHGPAKSREPKVPTLSDTKYWVMFAIKFKAFAKNYGDAEKVIINDSEINYVHEIMTNPIDLPASLLQSYSDIKQEELVFSQSKDSDKTAEPSATATSTGMTTRSSKKLQSKSGSTTIASAMSLDSIRETLFNAKLNEAVKAQSILRANEQALALKLDEAMQGSLRTKLQETPTYRDAFTANSLLNMWRIIKTTCMAGFTDEAILRFEAQFLKLKQIPTEDFHSYYLNFQTQLEFLQELLPGHKYDSKLLTALFIEGLDDTTYKRIRDQLYLNNESNLDARRSFPKTWEEAATYFRDMPADPTVITSSPTIPTDNSLTPTANMASSNTNSTTRNMNSDSRARTPRRKTPLNAEQQESENEFNYTGNDGRTHIMPTFIPIYDPENGRKLSKPERIKLANKHYAKRAEVLQQQRYQPQQREYIRSLPSQGYNSRQPPQRRIFQGRHQRRAHYVDMDNDSDYPTDRYDYFDIDSLDLSDSPSDRNSSLNTSSFYLNYFINTVSTSAIIFDPGATHSIVNDFSYLTNPKPIKPIKLNGVGGPVYIRTQGTFSIFGPAYYLPSLGLNLISQHQLIKQGYEITYNNNLHQYTITHKTHPTIIFNRTSDGLYTLNKSNLSHFNIPLINVTSDTPSSNLKTPNIREQKIIDQAISLHERCGHCGDDRVVRLINSGKILNCPISAKQFLYARRYIGPCLHCQRSKLTQDHTNSITIEQHYPTEDHEDNIFADIFYLKGAGNKIPYLVATTAKTRHLSVTALRSKTGANIAHALSAIIKQYKSFGYTIKRVITDHEANFKATELQLQMIGAQLIQNSPEMHSRQAERAIRTIKSLARAIYISLPYTLPTALYPYLLQYAAERYNIMPQRDNDLLSPRERITGRTLDFRFDLRAGFGAVGLFPVPLASQITDLAERGEIGIIIGNTPGKHGVCQVYIPTRKSICYRTKFTMLRIDESIRLMISRDQPRDPQLVPVEPPPKNINDLNNITPPLAPISTSSPLVQNTHAQPIPTTTTTNDNSLIASDDNNIDIAPNNMIMHTVVERRESDGSIPKQAEQAMEKEIRNVISYDVWDPVHKDQKITKAIRSLMIAVEKFTADGIFDKWKGRIAAMGNMLKRKVSTESTSPTMDMASLFLLINIANHYGCNMESFDIPSAYLNCNLNELIHMILDRDTAKILCKIDSKYNEFVRDDGTILVKLRKNLYGLREAGRKWYDHIKSHLINQGYNRLTTDPCVFIKRSRNSFSIIGLYVDDIFFFTNNNEWRDNLRKYFIKHFLVKKFSTNKISYLGLQIDNDIKTGVTKINQTHYLKELLKKFNIDITRSVKTPSTQDFFNEHDTNTTNVNQSAFRSAVMALMFAAKRTRSDILLHVTYLSSFCGHATQSHVNKLNRIMKYISATINKSIYIIRSVNPTIKLDIYADAGHLTHHDMKGHTGVLLTFNDNFIIALSKKQSIFSESTCESELYAAHSGGLLSKWIINMCQELSINIDLPITFHQDNQSTIKLSTKGYGDFMRTKHIQKRFFSIKDLEDRGLIKQKYCKTYDMKADLYTKSHDYAPFSRLRNSIFRNHHAQERSHQDDGDLLLVQGTVGNQDLNNHDLDPLTKDRPKLKRVQFNLDRNSTRYF